ncbi:MAG: hypothetical protein JOZ41_22530 [Chloroflexi bacterium]|nr:hypothetical protein [Chloroflexota bacterium]
MAKRWTYRVFVDDNFHYMDEGQRYELRRTFRDCKSAVAACQKIVDEFLAGNYKAGMTPEELWEGYAHLGEDPWISTEDPECQGFSSWDYARARCKEICDRSEEGADRGGSAGSGVAPWARLWRVAQMRRRD